MNAIEIHFDNSFDMLNPPVIFESSAAAHAAMMEVIGEVLTELKAEGVPLPSERQFLRDTTELLALYRRFAPPQH